MRLILSIGRRNYFLLPADADIGQIVSALADPVHKTGSSAKWVSSGRGEITISIVDDWNVTIAETEEPEPSADPIAT